MFSNGPKIVTTGLSLLADASDQLSYPGSGTAWTDVITGTTASLSGSISFTTDFQGSLVTANSSSVIIFPPSTANFGTNTFTVEFAFRPSQINGQHWILSKNSGSFPNWGVFVTGSSGSGRLVAFFNISSAVSCSLSSAQGSIVTGSNYIVDVSLNPSTNLSRLYINSETAATGSANGAGSLSATAPLFFSNINSGSNSGTVNSVFNIKAYNPRLNNGLVRQNYNAISNRLGLPAKPWIASIADSLLDLYPGAAAAYSLRQLSVEYSGFATRVRRSSDNTETNIGFDNSGNLDTVTLLNFCGAGNGFVTTWYDQSGNGRDATQSTGANQPQIVSSGSVILENGKIALRFDGSDDTLSVGNFDLYSNTNGQSIISVFKALNNSTNKQIISKYHAAQSKRQWFLSNDNYNVQELATSFNGSNLAQGVNTQTQQLFFGNWIPSTSTILYQNNTNSYSATTAATDISTTDASVLIGASFDNLSYVFANIQEIIVYDFSQASNRAAIQINVNSFYSIY